MLEIKGFTIDNEAFEKTLLECSEAVDMDPSNVLCVWAKSFLELRDKQLISPKRPRVVIPEEDYSRILSTLQLFLHGMMNMLDKLGIDKLEFEKFMDYTEGLLNELEENRKRRND